MLILSRKENESIKIGEDVEIKVIQTGKGYTKIGIKAPRSLMILRGELIEQVKSENLSAMSDEDLDLKGLSMKIKH